jgi:hypothetical protein
MERRFTGICTRPEQHLNPSIAERPVNQFTNCQRHPPLLCPRLSRFLSSSSCSYLFFSRRGLVLALPWKGRYQRTSDGVRQCGQLPCRCRPCGWQPARQLETVWGPQMKTGSGVYRYVRPLVSGDETPANHHIAPDAFIKCG